MPTLLPDALTDFAAELFRAAGAKDEESRIMAHSLVGSHLAGHDSHGVSRIKGYLKQLERGELVAGAELEVLHETPGIVHCDAQLGFGQVQARRLAERAMGKAGEIGIGCATARRCGHIGRLGEFTELAAERGFAAFVNVNDNGVFRAVAPPGGVEPCVSTNPLSLAVPTADGPLVLDISTSVVAAGKVWLRLFDHEPCPEGWLQDADGRPTTDPRVLKAPRPGTILPLGGEMAFKGFGLAVLLDVFVAGLSGGSCPPPQEGQVECNNVLFVAWDPEQFAGAEHLTRQAERLIASIRASRRKEGVDAIRLPGDRTQAIRQQRLSSGIPLSDATWDTLIALADQLGVAPPSGK